MYAWEKQVWIIRFPLNSITAALISKSYEGDPMIYRYKDKFDSRSKLII